MSGMKRLLANVLLLSVVCFSIKGMACGENWPRFRGPNGAGQSDATGIPTLWDNADFNWKVRLPGEGHSSPVVWDDRVFVTSADPDNATLHVEARQTKDGEIVWKRQFVSSVKPKRRRQGYAASTPALDRNQLYFVQVQPNTVFLVALQQQDGEEVWRVEIGPFECKYSYGTSPIVHDGLVVLAHEHMGESFLIAVEAPTGKVRWKIPRITLLTSYSVPCVYQPSGGTPQLIFQSTAHGITGVDPSNGTTAWQIDVGEERTIASPIVVANLIIATSGIGGGGVDLAAIRPATSGNTRPKVVYNVAKSLPYVPTPVAYGDLLFLWSDGGVVSCLDAETGSVQWRNRVGGNYSGSPVRVGNHLYCISRTGDVVVLAAADRFKLVSRNSLGEDSWSTPAVAEGRMYLRTKSHLMSLGGKLRPNP